MTHLGWAWQVYSLNLRKYLSYRVDFWARFLGSVIIQIAIAYFLWSAIFESSGQERIGGYSFHMLLVYYLIVPFIEQMTLGEGETGLSLEIYNGTVTRYIVYPLPLILYKYVSHLAYSTLNGSQLILTMILVSAFWGFPQEFKGNVSTILMFVPTILIGGYLIFALTTLLESVAFWADNVWSLMVMLRFCVGMLGGSYLPLSMYPPWAQEAMGYLPFQFAISFPIRVLLGQVETKIWLAGLGVATVWAAAITLLAHLTIERGTRNFTGVGM